MDSMKENSKRSATLNEIVANDCGSRMLGGKHDVKALLQTIQQLETKLAQSETIIQNQNRAKARIIENIKTKRTLLEASKVETAQLRLSQKALQTENHKLHQDLNVATTARDAFKNKLRLQNETAKESKANVVVLQSKLDRLTKTASLQSDLLQEYRRLSLHTGFYKWGKPIRALEAQLAAAEEEED